MFSRSQGRPDNQLISSDLIDEACDLLSEGRQGEALSVFMEVGESLALCSVNDLQRDPVIDALRLPVSFEKLSDKQLLVYASWVHHTLLQLIVAKRTWTTNRYTRDMVNQAIERFCSFIRNNNIESVLDSGYFLGINTLLNLSR